MESSPQEQGETCSPDSYGNLRANNGHKSLTYPETEVGKSIKGCSNVISLV